MPCTLFYLLSFGSMDETNKDRTILILIDWNCEIICKFDKTNWEMKNQNRIFFRSFGGNKSSTSNTNRLNWTVDNESWWRLFVSWIINPLAHVSYLISDWITWMCMSSHTREATQKAHHHTDSNVRKGKHICTLNKACIGKLIEW